MGRGEAGGWRERRLTGIELLAIGLESAPVMHVDGVIFPGFPPAFHGERDIDLQVFRSQDANSRRSEQRKREEDSLHLDHESTEGRRD